MYHDKVEGVGQGGFVSGLLSGLAGSAATGVTTAAGALGGLVGSLAHIGITVGIGLGLNELIGPHKIEVPQSEPLPPVRQTELPSVPIAPPVQQTPIYLPQAVPQQNIYTNPIFLGVGFLLLLNLFQTSRRK